MFSDALDTSIDLLDASMGYLQIFDSDEQALAIVAQRGFSEDALTPFRLVGFRSGGSCGEALASGRRIVVEDAKQDALYEHHRAAVELAGYSSVQSTPLMSSAGEILGMITTHFHGAFTPGKDQLRVFDLFAKQTSWFLELALKAQASQGNGAVRDSLLAALLGQLSDPVKPMLRHSATLLRHVQRLHAQGEAGSSGALVLAIARDLQAEIALLGQVIEKIQMANQDEVSTEDDLMQPHWAMIRNSRSMTSRSLELINGSRSLIEQSRSMIDSTASQGRLKPEP
jgi:GAF domain-containing protein